MAQLEPMQCELYHMFKTVSGLRVGVIKSDLRVSQSMHHALGRIKPHSRRQRWEKGAFLMEIFPNMEVRSVWRQVASQFNGYIGYVCAKHCFSKCGLWNLWEPPRLSKNSWGEKSFTSYTVLAFLLMVQKQCWVKLLIT